jgi:hypothetical protein
VEEEEEEMSEVADKREVGTRKKVNYKDSLKFS